jgi:arsenate reductase
MTTTIYHNPRCSKSRQTLEMLQQRELDLDIVSYLDTPPDAATLAQILDLLGLQPRQLMRRQQTEYKALGLDNESLSRAELIDAMVANPILIERPIVLHNGKAAIGRPLQQVEDIL